MALFKKIKKARKVARIASKGLVGAGKIASASGATGVGRKMQAGGRVGRAATAATRGQGMKAAKNVRALRR